jgi:hypothetical protein
MSEVPLCGFLMSEVPLCRFASADMAPTDPREDAANAGMFGRSLLALTVYNVSTYISTDILRI